MHLNATSDKILTDEVYTSRPNANQTKTFVWNWASMHRLYIDLVAQLALSSEVDFHKYHTYGRESRVGLQPTFTAMLYNSNAHVNDWYFLLIIFRNWVAFICSLNSIEWRTCGHWLVRSCEWIPPNIYLRIICELLSIDEPYREKGQKCYCLPNFIIFGVALLPWHVSTC